MADKYTVVTSVKGYYTSLDAKNRKNPKTTVKPASYYVFNESKGMINVTSKKGTPGSWINPDDNKKPASKVTSTVSASSSAKVNSTSVATSPVKEAAKYDSLYSGDVSIQSRNKKVYNPKKDEYIPIYIINCLNGGVIEFNCEPEEFSESNTAQFDSQDIRGRSSPYQGYNNSGPRTMNYTFPMHQDLCKDGLLNTVNKLRSLTYPNYSGSLRPPSCIIRFGDMIHTKGIVTDVSISWQKPYRDGIYLSAEATITINEVVDEPLSASQIWSKGGFL